MIIKNPKHNVEFRLHKGITVNDYDYRQVAHEFPVPSTFTGIINGEQQCVSEDYFLTAANKQGNPRLLERVVNGVRMFFQRVHTFRTGLKTLSILIITDTALGFMMMLIH